MRLNSTIVFWLLTEYESISVVEVVTNTLLCLKMDELGIQIARFTRGGGGAAMNSLHMDVEMDMCFLGSLSSQETNKMQMEHSETILENLVSLIV